MTVTIARMTTMIGGGETCVEYTVNQPLSASGDRRNLASHDVQPGGAFWE
jgi:hypothetical protein